MQLQEKDDFCSLHGINQTARYFYINFTQQIQIQNAF